MCFPEKHTFPIGEILFLTFSLKLLFPYLIFNSHRILHQQFRKHDNLNRKSSSKSKRTKGDIIFSFKFNVTIYEIDLIIAYTYLFLALLVNGLVNKLCSRHRMLVAFCKKGLQKVLL